ncbi:T9SS type A sorting domain-containing protein [Flavobacterium rakeshii]|uniref:T9SS type A sorting domain-containing protein n=1 Tax=Flavobacterium rakeshii TaxID=1038845 RepID=A0A6N8H9S9_9FLAO|nr:T9SS type A sorting domain-containing protein [Flavobacterium rakeshii]MUV02325.1 T9SS type A sorting domain-containing protein [Flavobacterium rakeshii]
MKKALLSLASIVLGFSAIAQEVDENGYTTVNVSMQPAYANQVYFKLETNTQTPAVTSSWDIAFQKAGGMSLGAVRVNDGKVTCFEASADITAWESIDVANESNWTQLYNSETEWSTGAFDNGSENTPSFGYGWGVYDMTTHHVTGTRIFVLKTSATNYKKIILQDLDPMAGTFTFKYATWNGTEWSEDETTVIDFSENEGTEFIYYSMETNNTVTVAPADTDWDFVFNKYFGEVSMGGTDTVMYSVTGALHNSNTGITVAVKDEAGETSEDITLPADEDYTEDINTIGDDWKAFDQSTMSYTIPEKTYYVKYEDGTVYRMYFLTFEGTSTGNLSFKYKNVSSSLGTGDFDMLNTNFSLYPNPSSDKNVTLNFSTQNTDANHANITVYSITGSMVYNTVITNGQPQQINLSALNSGLYLVKVQAGNYTDTKKLIIK